MLAAFGSGAMFSLVSGVGGPNQAANAVTSGLFFALVQGGLFQVIYYLISLSKITILFSAHVINCFASCEHGVLKFWNQLLFESVYNHELFK